MIQRLEYWLASMMYGSRRMPTTTAMMRKRMPSTLPTVLTHWYRKRPPHLTP